MSNNEHVALPTVENATAAGESVPVEIGEGDAKTAEEPQVKKPLHKRITHVVKEKVHEKLRESMEDDDALKIAREKNVPESLLYILWLLGQIAFFFLIIYLTYQSCVSDQQTKYLSLDFTSQATGSKSSSYRLCLTVPFPLTGTWVMDTSGLWSGFSKYSPGLGVYEFRLADFSKSHATYYSFMADVRSQIALVGANSSSNDPATNLAYWMAWSYVIPNGKNKHIVTFTGDPSYIFDRFYKSAVLLRPGLPCFSIPSINYQKDLGAVTISYDYVSTGASGYTSAAFSGGNPSTGCCASNTDTSTCVLPPPSFGYNSVFDSAYFRIKYNINTLITAFAVNLGISKFSVLDYVKSEFETQTGCTKLTDTTTPSTTYGQTTPYLTWSGTKCVMAFGSDKYEIQVAMDNQYPNADPVYCLHRTYSASSSYTFDRVCLLKSGNAFAYPFFNHMGISGSSSEKDTEFYNPTLQCTCSATSAIDGTGGVMKSLGEGSDSYCNTFDLMHGFIVFNSKYADVAFYKILTMASAMSAKEINQASYYPAFAAIRTGGEAGQSQNQKSGQTTWSFTDLIKLTTATTTNLQTLSSSTSIPVNSINAFSFCENGNEGCVIYAMNTYDEYDNRINKEYFDLTSSSCSNSFTIAPWAWSQNSTSDDQVNSDSSLVTGALYVPPSTLYQDYYECYNTLFVSLSLAFGAASGSAGSITPAFMMILVTISVYFFGKTVTETNEHQLKQQDEQEEGEEKPSTSKSPDFQRSVGHSERKASPPPSSSSELPIVSIVPPASEVEMSNVDSGPKLRVASL